MKSGKVFMHAQAEFKSGRVVLQHPAHPPCVRACISSPANNCMSSLYERARLEMKCYFLKLLTTFLSQVISDEWKTE